MKRQMNQRDQIKLLSTALVRKNALITIVKLIIIELETSSKLPITTNQNMGNNNAIFGHIIRQIRSVNSFGPGSFIVPKYLRGTNQPFVPTDLIELLQEQIVKIGKHQTSNSFQLNAIIEHLVSMIRELSFSYNTHNNIDLLFAESCWD